MMKKLGFSGGTPTPASTRTAPTAAPKPTAPTAPARTAPAAAPPQGGNDGFSTRAAPSSGSHVPKASTQGARDLPQQRPPGKDVTAGLAQDPVKFAANNVLNMNGVEPPSTVVKPTPGRPFVPANDSTVTVNAYQRPGGNANMTLSPAGGQGLQAHYLHYLSQNSEQGNPLSRFAGISGVPQHPVNTPTTVVTGTLNGCAVHAFHDKNTQTMSFVHHANYSKDGPATLAQFQQAHPNLQLAATLEPKDYAHPTGRKAHGYTPPKDEETGATAFAQYNKNTQQWSLHSQVNDYEQTSPEKWRQDGRPPLKRPDFQTPLQQIAIPPYQP